MSCILLKGLDVRGQDRKQNRTEPEWIELNFNHFFFSMKPDRAEVINEFI